MPFTDYKPYKQGCKHPEHYPPTHIVLEAGVHTYQCPACLIEVKIYTPDFNLSGRAKKNGKIGDFLGYTTDNLPPQR